MPDFNKELKDEYVRRVRIIEEAIVDLERWLGEMTTERRLSFLQRDPVTYGGQVCVCDEDFVAELEELSRDDDEEAEDEEDEEEDPAGD